MDRAAFLRAGGALIVACVVPGASVADVLAVPGRVDEWPPLDLGDLRSWLRLDNTGSISCFTGKVDLGQGNRTSLSQIVAEELDVELSTIELVMGDTARTLDQGPTVDSMTIASAGSQLRAVAAVARQALVAQAASDWGSAPEAIRVKNGTLTDGASGRSTTYWEIVRDRTLSVVIPVERAADAVLPEFFPDGQLTVGDAPIKPPSSYRTVGKSVPRIDIPTKVDGRHIFIQDVKVPGMLHGRVIRPSGLGSHLVSHGRPTHGARVVKIKDFLGVVADREWDAIRAAEELPVRWSGWHGLPRQVDLYKAIRSSPSTDRLIEQAGDVEASLAHSEKRLSATYTTSIETHGSIGPSCAIADVRRDEVHIWSGTQAPHLVQGSVAEALGVPPETVHVIAVEASGCYGRNGADPATVDAALMSQAVGRPVRVQWMRADEHGWDPKGPATLHELRAGLSGGRVVAYDHQGWIPASFSLTIVGAVHAGRSAREPVPGFWTGPLLYDFPASRQLSHDQDEIGASANNGVGLVSSWLRSPAQMQITFAMESFVDELAHAVGADPVAFRLSHLTDSRMRAVLARAAKEARWKPRTSASSPDRGSVAHGRGVAISLRVGTYNAAVTDVEVNRMTGHVRVKRVWLIQDNGLSINPRAVRLGIEAAVVQTVSRALLEHVSFDRSNVTSLSWDTYPILTFTEAPSVEVVLIGDPSNPATGSGEPCVNPIAPAIANAIFDATGVRLRHLPLQDASARERLRAA